MKTRIFLIAGAVLAGLTACKNEQQEQADRAMDRYTAYVDSVSNVAEAEAISNWEAIEAGYEERSSELEATMANVKDRDKVEEKRNEAKAKYEEMKTRYEQKMEAEAQANSGNAALKASLFGPQMGNDMTFSWVNKDNILSVYEKFYEEFDKNQKNYSREDLDEIKTYYEALDTRKNTVEKEGLSSEDNRKIAGIKLKFAPKFKWERLTSKGEENQEAKDKAN